MKIIRRIGIVILISTCILVTRTTAYSVRTIDTIEPIHSENKTTATTATTTTTSTKRSLQELTTTTTSTTTTETISVEVDNDGEITSTTTTTMVELYDDSILAENGNGDGGSLSSEQIDKIHQLYDKAKHYVDVNGTTTTTTATIKERKVVIDDWLDLEVCRRYLVARQWNITKAEAQLQKTLNWRQRESKLLSLSLADSAKPRKNPHSMSMRPIGTDGEGRPIAYTCFAEALDRWDVEANAQHMTLLMEESAKLIKQRQQNGLSRRADQRQWVWVVDFDGFSFRDQNPNTGIFTIRVMENYPEMLSSVVLIGAPWLFGASWKVISSLLDERVAQKVLFAKKDGNLKHILRERLGEEAAEWLVAETEDNEEKRKVAAEEGPKKYWVPPPTAGEGGHDPRGLPSYVNSEYYIRTPGDAYEEDQQQKKERKEKPTENLS